VAAIYSGLMWQAVIEGLVAQDFARLRGKAVGEPDEGKPCAVSRTERIATGGGRSSGQMTLIIGNTFERRCRR